MIHETHRVYGKVKELPIDALRQAFSCLSYVKLALLFGSRASVNELQVHGQSDYDFAVLLDKSQDCDWGHLAKVRTDLGTLLPLPDEDFDVVDLQIANAPLLKGIQAQYVVLNGDVDELRCLFKQHEISMVKTAECEKEILDTLCAQLMSNGALSKIELRAARASLQILIENSIGKARRILKHYDCPLVPSRGRDAFSIMYDAGLINDEHYQDLMQAVGFRNAMIHDYMNFDESILINIVREQKYGSIYHFLIQQPNYRAVQISRIENFSL
jgi:uncharacterized protein YutE (UPF0331/DUF86 family)